MAAVVDEARGLDRGRAAGSTANDVTTRRLVAKAAVVLGLPNLLDPARASPSRLEEGLSVEWECESRCSCTPLACISSARTPRGGEGGGRTNSRDKLQTAENVSRLGSSVDCSERETRPESIAGPSTPHDDRGGLTEDADDVRQCESAPAPSGEGKPEREHSEIIPEAESADDEAPGKSEPENERQEEVKDGSQLQREGAPFQRQNSAIHRRKMRDYEREWTFKPRLNFTSLRLVSRGNHCSVPVSHRLYQRKTHSVPQLQEEFTFAPKLNSASLRLAQERTGRLPEVCTCISPTYCVCSPQLSLTRLTLFCDF